MKRETRKNQYILLVRSKAKNITMSYIDSFDHEFVGFFGYLPVYHPLETVEADDKFPADFGCDPTNLVLGGGSGEHPALILRRPDCAVGHYIANLLDRIRTHNPKDAEAFTAQAEHWEPFLDMALATDMSEILHFAGWDIYRYHSFYTMCSSPRLRTPYDEEEDGWFEAWLSQTLGEFVIFAMPELFQTLDIALPDIQVLLQLRIGYQLNIMLPPPGYPLPYGHKKDAQIPCGHNRWFPR